MHAETDSELSKGSVLERILSRGTSVDVNIPTRHDTYGPPCEASEQGNLLQTRTVTETFNVTCDTEKIWTLGREHGGPRRLPGTLR